MFALIRIAIIASTLIFFAESSVAAGDDSPAAAVSDPALQEELLVRIERDQQARWAGIECGQQHGADGVVDEELLTDAERTTYTKLWADVADIDAENTEWLRGVVDDKGWPTYSAVGPDSADAAWLIVQHADEDISFQRRCLDLIAALPSDEVSKSNFAYLTDRVLLAEGEDQIYGTQFVVREGKWVPSRLLDSDNVDARRAEVGLQPLAEYAEMLTKMMSGEKGE